jgi:hypothetical protein
VFWACAVIGIAAPLAQDSRLFRIGDYPYGDAALNSLLVTRAQHFSQIVGNYSRVGFHHPGPALLYMLAAGKTIFYDLLHVVPAPYNGELVGVVVYVAAFLALAATAIYRATGSVPAAALSFGLMFAFAARQGLFGTDWFPVLYVPAFLLLVVAAASLASGRTSELPLYTLAAGTLVHGHVSFLMFVTVTAFVAGGAWYWCHHGAVREELRRHRTGLCCAAVLVGLFALPLVIEVVLHFPGPWPSYWAYVVHGKRATPGVTQVLRFVAGYWTDLQIGDWWYVVAALVGTGLLATERDKSRRNAYLAAYGIIALESVLMVFYVWHGVGTLMPEHRYAYVGWFYETIPLLLLIFVATHSWLRARALIGVETRPLLRVTPYLLAGAGVLSVFAAGLASPVLGYWRPSNSEYLTIVSRIAADDQQSGRTIALVGDQSPEWWVGAGIAAEMQQAGVRWCLDQHQQTWVNLYTATYLCKGSGERLVIAYTTKRPPTGAAVLWTGSFGRGKNVSVYAPGRA